MKNYKHLTFTQRLQIEAGLKMKMPIKNVALNVGIHISTIYREIKRGRYVHRQSYTDYVYETQYRYKERYSPDIAEQHYRENLQAKGAPLKIGKDHVLANFIEDRIVNGKLSPKAVLGEIKRKSLQFKTTICVGTLYSYIYKGIFLRLSMKHLTFGQRKQPRNKVTVSRPPRGMSIEQRPCEIANRNTFGHWEMDCVCGPTNNVLLVLSERLTRKEIIFKMPDQKAESVIHCLNRLERSYGSRFRQVFKSITVDNGSEFADCKGMEKSIFNGKRTAVYYCHPYCSSERGTNERLNREIRRLLPKGTDLSKISIEDVQRVEDWVNNYPRGVLGYATSAELFDQQLSLLN